jgi:hypothetical protein
MIIYVTHNKQTNSLSVTTDTGELDTILNPNTVVNTDEVLEFEIAVDISPLQEMEEILPEEGIEE